MKFYLMENVEQYLIMEIHSIWQSKIEKYYNNSKEFFLKTKLAKKNIKRFTLRKNIMGYENLFNKL